MNNQKLKKRNIKYTFLGYILLMASTALLSFFLPFYLKQEGLTILQIGFLFTLGLAIGNLFFSLVFSKIIRKIKLKTGLRLALVFGFLHNFVFFLFPNPAGIMTSKFLHQSNKPLKSISSDVTLQHNTSKKDHRKISSLHLAVDSGGYMIGIVLSLILISYIGFRYSSLFFALITIPAFLFYSKVSDKTRFKLEKREKLPKTSNKLKLVLFSELIYWFALASSFALIITFLVTDQFQGSMLWIAYLFIGLYGSIVITTLLTYRFLDKLNLVKTSIIGMFILFLSSVIIILSTKLHFVLIAMILEGIGAGIWTPSKTAIYWKLTKKESREKVAGYLFGVRGFVNSLGPLFGGFLVASIGILAPFYFKAGISLVCVGIYIFLMKKIK